MNQTEEIDGLISQAFPEENDNEAPGFILDVSLVKKAPFKVNLIDMEARQPIICFNIEKYNAAVKDCLSLFRPKSL